MSLAHVHQGTNLFSGPSFSLVSVLVQCYTSTCTPRHELVSDKLVRILTVILPIFIFI